MIYSADFVRLNAHILLVLSRCIYHRLLDGAALDKCVVRKPEEVVDLCARRLVRAAVLRVVPARNVGLVHNIAVLGVAVLLQKVLYRLLAYVEEAHDGKRSLVLERGVHVRVDRHRDKSVRAARVADRAGHRVGGVLKRRHGDALKVLVVREQLAYLVGALFALHHRLVSRIRLTVRVRGYEHAVVDIILRVEVGIRVLYYLSGLIPLYFVIPADRDKQVRVVLQRRRNLAEGGLPRSRVGARVFGVERNVVPSARLILKPVARIAQLLEVVVGKVDDRRARLEHKLDISCGLFQVVQNDVRLDPDVRLLRLLDLRGQHERA